MITTRFDKQDGVPTLHCYVGRLKLAEIVLMKSNPGWKWYIRTPWLNEVDDFPDDERHYSKLGDAMRKLWQWAREKRDDTK